MGERIMFIRLGGTVIILRSTTTVSWKIVEWVTAQRAYRSPGCLEATNRPTAKIA